MTVDGDGGSGDGDPTARERACFEAGIKLGGLYHQFVGAALSRDTADGLADAIADSVRQQRYVTDADVQIDGVAENRFGYGELAGTMLDVELTVEADGARVAASMREEDGYPLMRIDAIE